MRNVFALAEHLHMTVGALMREMTAVEFDHWMEYARIKESERST